VDHLLSQKKIKTDLREFSTLRHHCVSTERTWIVSEEAGMTCEVLPRQRRVVQVIVVECVVQHRRPSDVIQHTGCW